MKTLVYFASGPMMEKYQNLNFEEIYLIDNCFNIGGASSSVFKEGKVTCIGMDCLESIELLKKQDVKIDYFIALNEGLYEGGGRYAINSDMFLGFVMPLFKDDYVHIMNKNYYQKSHNVSMDLPYKMEEITESDTRYISPSFFSADSYHLGQAKVFNMNKFSAVRFEIPIKKTLQIFLQHESIWNFYDQLDAIVISYSEQGQLNFFNTIKKVLNINVLNLDNILIYCEEHKIQKIGFTPWGKGKYLEILNKFEQHVGVYPKEIYLFHLNRNDYKDIRKFQRTEMLITL